MLALEGLKTRRLSLRPLAHADAPAVARLLDDLDVSRWLTVVPHPYTEADAHDFIDHLEGAGTPFDGMAIHGPEGLAGVVGISTSLGYWLGRPFWGRGYATEAAGALVDHYFRESDAEVLTSGYFGGNVGSRGVLTKLGFRRDGARPEHCRATGGTVTLFSMRLTREGWAARK